MLQFRRARACCTHTCDSSRKASSSSMSARGWHAGRMRSRSPRAPRPTDSNLKRGSMRKLPAARSETDALSADQTPASLRSDPAGTPLWSASTELGGQFGAKRVVSLRTGWSDRTELRKLSLDLATPWWSKCDRQAVLPFARLRAVKSPLT